MKIAQICTNVMSGSVGNIVRNLYEGIKEHGDECLICYGRGKIPEGYKYYKFNTSLDIYYHVIMARLFDSDGLHSKMATKRLIKRLKDYAPDIVHIHCLHGYYINYPLLFEYFKQSKVKVVWTMHDCWAFTGHCCYFDYIQCNCWKIICDKCKQKSSFPKSMLMEHSNRNYIYKKRLFGECLNNITIVTPSRWLSDLVKQSFLCNSKCVVINNGIDTNVFYPRNSQNLPHGVDINKKIILGVASIWDKRKGLNDFLELADIVNDSYQIILIGISQKQKKLLPKNILGIERTDSLDTLAKLYSVAQVLFNPTYEDNYPTVNLEAIACGTPIVTYRTGGSPEIIKNGYCGLIINQRDYLSLIGYVNKIYQEKVKTEVNNTSYLSYKYKCDEYYKVYTKGDKK